MCLLSSNRSEVSHVFTLLEDHNSFMQIYNISKPKAGESVTLRQDSFGEIQKGIQNYQMIIAKKIFELFNKAKAEGRIDDKEIQ